MMEFSKSSRAKFALSDPHLHVRTHRRVVWRFHNFSFTFDDGVASVEDGQRTKLFQVCFELPKRSLAAAEP